MSSNYGKIPPPPPFPPLLLLNQLERKDKGFLYQPNRDIYGNVTMSLGNVTDVENHIRDMNFQRRKEYDKKSKMCKDFKNKEKSNSPGFFANIINNVKSRVSSVLSPKSSSSSNKKDKKLSEKDKKLLNNAILIDINTKVDSSKYKNNIINWSKDQIKINTSRKKKKIKQKKTLKRKKK